MRKFKHITGAIATKMTDQKINHIFQYSSMEFGYIHPKLIEDSPEWEEIIEKDYEILSVKYNQNKCIYTINNDKTYFQNIKGSISYEAGLRGNLLNKEQEGYEIYLHSIKRLSDGEIFTIGDRISLKLKVNEVYGVITQLYISHEQLRFYCGNLGGVLCHDIDKRNNFMKHVPEKPLFTTEDGVEVFKDDKGPCLWNNYPYVDTFDNYKYKECANGSPVTVEDKYNYCKIFSTKEKAEEYIILNKNCLSMNDIIENKNFDFSPREITKLKELIKLKLEKTHE